MNLKDLLELLYTARSRFSSLQMEWEYRYRADLTDAAVQELARASSGSTGIVRARAEEAAPPAQESSVLWKLWWQKPGCWRDEQHSREMSLRIFCRGEWFRYGSGGAGLTTNVEPAKDWPAVQLSRTPLRPGRQTPSLEEAVQDYPGVDPSFLLATHDLEVLGESEYAGRRALRVRGVYRRGKDLPWEPFFWKLAEAQEFLVDVERGVLLRYTSWVGGQRLAQAAVQRVVFDQPIPEEVFSFIPPPGARVEVIA